MTPDELLRLYPRETLRWWRGRLGLDQPVFAWQLRVSRQTVVCWEAGRFGSAPRRRARLAALLAPQLATSEGEAFARSLRRGEEPGSAG